ncbi:probable protein phosphatase 2C 49 [Tanacetum coccineum]
MNDMWTNVIRSCQNFLGIDHTARIWAIADWTNSKSLENRIGSLHVLKHDKGRPDKRRKDVTSVACNLDGTLLATSSMDGLARIWNTTGNLISTFSKHRGIIRSIKWNKTEDYLLKVTNHNDICYLKLLDLDGRNDMVDDASCGSQSFVDDGYLNDKLSVTRALGDWDMKFPRWSTSPLIAESEFQQIVLTEEDEFLIIGCDGIWDASSSQQTVKTVRRGLLRHDDPEQCAKALVREAIRLNTYDNLTVIVLLQWNVTKTQHNAKIKCCSISTQSLYRFSCFQ